LEKIEKIFKNILESIYGVAEEALAEEIKRDEKTASYSGPMKLTNW
jgi:hypothetical protein